MDKIEYIWDHWKFNAEQRLKAFNFYIALSIFANGGVFTAIEKCVGPVVQAVLGLFLLALVGVFWIMDSRSQQLYRLSIPALKDYESELPEKCRLFHLDEPNLTNVVRYTNAFRALFGLQLLFGLAVIAHAIVSMTPATFGLERPPYIGSACNVAK